MFAWRAVGVLWQLKQEGRGSHYQKDTVLMVEVSYQQICDETASLKVVSPCCSSQHQWKLAPGRGHLHLVLGGGALVSPDLLQEIAESAMLAGHPLVAQREKLEMAMMVCDDQKPAM